MEDFVTKYRLIKNGLGKFKVQMFHSYNYAGEQVWEDVCDTRFSRSGCVEIPPSIIRVYTFDTYEEAKKLFDSRVSQEREEFLSKQVCEVIDDDSTIPSPNPCFSWDYVYNLEQKLWEHLKVHGVPGKCESCGHFEEDREVNYAGCGNTSGREDTTCFGLMCTEYKPVGVENV